MRCMAVETKPGKTRNEEYDRTYVIADPPLTFGRAVRLWERWRFGVTRSNQS